MKTVKKEKILRILYIAIGIIGIVFTFFYPIAFAYLRNVYEARVRHIAMVAVIYMIWTLLLFLLSLLWQKSIIRATFATNGLLVITLNFNLLSSVLSGSFTLFVQIVFAVMLLVLLIVLVSKLAEQTICTMNCTWTLMLTVLIVINMVPVAPYLVTKMKIGLSSTSFNSDLDVKDKSEVQENEPEVVMDVARNAVDFPNVYFMIFDEYGGPENLSHYYAYDNSEFWSWLEDNGFDVSYDSYNSESISTITNVPNVLNMDYVVDHDNEWETFMDYLYNPAIYRVFEEKQYEINTTSYVAFLDDTHSKHYYENKEFYEDTVGYYILRNSIFIYLYDSVISRFVNDGGYASGDSYGYYLVEALDYYRQLALLGDDNNRFNLGYFMCPHIPLLYRSDGSEIPADMRDPQVNPESYIDYLKWTNERIKEIVGTIIENDPNSIIILMSDHGSRSQTFEEDSHMEDPDLYKKNILNCVYYKGETIEIDGLSGINTVIKVLDSEYNLGIEYK